MMTRILYFVLGCLALTQLFSQAPAIEWQKTLGGTVDDEAYAIQLTADGGYIMAGSTKSNNGDVSGYHGGLDAWVVKLNGSGTIQWQTALGGTGDDNAKAIQQTADGGYIMAGSTSSNNGNVSGNHGGFDAWLVKLDGSGNIQWQKCLGGTSYDYANAIQQATDGGYIMAGETDSNNGDVSGQHGYSVDAWVVKLDGSGSIQWQKCLGGTNEDQANAIQQTTDGGFIMAGKTASNDGNVTGHIAIDDCWVVKLDGSGSIQWQKVLGGGDIEVALAIQQTADGGYIMAARTMSEGWDVSGNHAYGYYDAWVVKLDGSGNIQWQRCLGSVNNDPTNAILQTADGGYIMAGETGGNGGDVSGHHGEIDGWVVKLDGSGILQWQKCLGSIYYDRIYAIQQTADGSYILAGYTDTDEWWTTGGNDAWVVKLAPEAPVCSYSLSPASNLNVPAAGPTDHTVDVTAPAGCAWTASSNSPWITITAGNAGSGNGTVSYTVSSNGGAYRSGSLTIAGQTFQITQAEACTATISPASNLNVPAAGPTGHTVDVTTPAGCDWTASSNSSWITLTAGNSGTGNGTVSYSVADYTDETARNGSLTVAGQDFQVTQLGTPPPSSYSISASCSRTGPDLLPMYFAFLPVTPLKICADGSNATIVTVTVSGGSVALDDLRFRLQNATGDINFSGDFNNGYNTAVPGQVTTAFTHPTYVASGNTQYREDVLEVYEVANSGVVLASVNVRIYRAPIAFVHGFLGSQSTFKVMDENLLLYDKYPPDPDLLSGSPLLWRAGYGLSSAFQLNYNRKVVPNAIDSVLVQAMKNGYSCGKATVIGHSMGGILGRMYLQSLNNVDYRNDMDRLITINTPHYGSQLLSYCSTPESIIQLAPIGCPLLYNLIGTTANALGAVNDMTVGSGTILSLNTAPQLVTVPSAALSSEQSGDPSKVARALRAALYFAYSPTYKDIFNGETHDLAVPMSSQQAGLSTAPWVSLQWHAGSTDNDGMTSMVRGLLDVDPTGTGFSQSGFPQGSLSFSPTEPDDHAVASSTRSVDSVEIVTPYPGQLFTPGEQVTVNITFSDAITDMVLVVTGNSIEPITIDTIGVSPLVFQVPSGALGTLNLFLMAGDGSDWTASDSTHITISSAAIPDSIVCSPTVINLPLGILQYVQASGFFGDVSPVDLYGSLELSVGYDTDYLAYQGNGIFQAIAVGNTFVAYSYLGAVDTVFFTIMDDPAALIAAFDYSAERICANSSITFTDHSQGLVTSRQWSFPGGVPATSTDTMPTVTYAAVGSYPVTLITTFVNGTDTLTINELVGVNAPPNASFTDMGDSLFAVLDGASYQWLNCDNAPMPIPGARGQGYVPTVNGNYAVVVTDGGCSSTSDCYFYSTTGLNASMAQSGISVQPNPTHGSFSVMLPERSSSVRVEVKDIAGRTVLVNEFKDVERIQLELDAPSGVYMLHVYRGEERSMFKVVKN